MDVNVKSCGAATAVVELVENHDGVNPPRMIQIHALETAHGIEFSIGGGDGYAINDDGDLPRLFEGTVK